MLGRSIGLNPVIQTPFTQSPVLVNAENAGGEGGRAIELTKDALDVNILTQVQKEFGEFFL